MYILHYLWQNFLKIWFLRAPDNRVLKGVLQSLYINSMITGSTWKPNIIIWRHHHTISRSLLPKDCMEEMRWEPTPPVKTLPCQSSRMRWEPTPNLPRRHPPRSTPWRPRGWRKDEMRDYATGLHLADAEPSRRLHPREQTGRKGGTHVCTHTYAPTGTGSKVTYMVSAVLLHHLEARGDADRELRDAGTMVEWCIWIYLDIHTIPRIILSYSNGMHVFLSKYTWNSMIFLWAQQPLDILYWHYYPTHTRYLLWRNGDTMCMAMV